MAFVTCRENVDFFGIMNGENIDLFTENFSSSELGFQHDILSLNDSFPVNVELQSKNISVENDDNVPNVLTSASVSDCGHFIAATDLKKSLFLWKKEKGKWTPVSCRALVRKAYKVIFTYRGSEIVVSDKGGDVFLFSVVNSAENGKMILGHINIILDMAISKNDRYLITSDRENKIRVSDFPNCYSICTYCLGHEEFVCALQFVPVSEELLVSSSGDGTLRVWRYGNGEQLSFYELNKSLMNSSDSPLNSGDDKGVQDSKVIKSELSKVFVKTLRYCRKLNVIAALFHADASIAIFQMSSDTLELIQTVSLKDIPIDVHFNGDGVLWAILSSEPPTVVSFHCAAKGTAQFTEIVATELATGALTAEINKKLAASTLSLEYQMDFTYMFNQCANFVHEREKCNNEQSAKRNKLSA